MAAITEVTYELEAGSHPSDDLIVYRIEAEEELSRPFSLDVSAIVHKDADVDEPGLMSQTATLTIRSPDRADRHLSGMIAGVRGWEEGKGDHHRRIRLRVVPTLWKLGQARTSRIFQRKTIPAIVKEVLDAWKITQVWGKSRGSGPDGLSGQYKPREYVVQYGETDLDFVSRLLEEVGIFWFFEHEPGKHTLVLVDANGSCLDIPGDAKLPFRDAAMGKANEEYLDAFSARLEVRPGAVALRDYNFLRPTVDLTSVAKGQQDADLEVFDYPAGYEDGGAGSAIAKMRLEERRARVELLSGAGLCPRLQPGAQFELEGHPIPALDDRYLILSVHHEGEQLQARQAATQGRQLYRCTVEAIRASVPFRPERRTPRPVIPGPQTAVVVGPSGEEIHTDQHGRIQVKFHWDRTPKKGADCSCWMRVSQAWAGPGWGALYLPRIGQEVVVEFLEGDPDRPLVTGAVYNGVNPPPVALPSDKTKSTLRSDTSPGSGGSNELRFEDLKGSEEAYLHAQKDLAISVENDKTQHVGGNESLTVVGNRSKEVGGNQDLTVTKDDTTTVAQMQKLTVGIDRTVSVGANHLETVGGNQVSSVGAAYALTVGAASVESVAAVKALSVGGAYAVSVGGALNEAVGGIKAEEVAGAKSEIVGGKKTETVGGNRSLHVKGELAETVGGKRTVKVAKDQTTNVGGKHQHTVKEEYAVKAKTITFSAADEMVLKVGSATLSLKKNGDVTVKGGKIQVKASGDVTLKGSKISQN